MACLGGSSVLTTVYMHLYLRINMPSHRVPILELSIVSAVLCVVQSPHSNTLETARRYMPDMIRKLSTSQEMADSS